MIGIGDKMKLVTTVVLLNIHFVFVGASGVQRANEYMDTLLGRFLRDEGRSSIIENVPVSDFNITVKSNFISNRDLHARFYHGRIIGLSKITRDGNCKPSKWVSGNITLECRLNLSPVMTAYAAEVRGHTLSGSEEFFDFFVRVRRCTATFVAHSKPNKPASIKTFVVDETTSDIGISPPIKLNTERRKSFEDQAKHHAHAVIQNVVQDSLPKALMEVSSDILLPLV